jgi:hypothetical protein
LVPARLEVLGQLVAHVDPRATFVDQFDRPGKWHGASGQPDGDRGRQDSGAVEFFESGQLRPPGVRGTGVDVEQRQHLDDDVGVDLYRDAALVAVGRRDAVCRGDLAKVLRHGRVEGTGRGRR